jgi:ferredoxin, 2Fe-2S
MPKITVLPHPQLCPLGKEFTVRTGTAVCAALLDNDVAIEHACDMSCACTTCHIIVRHGLQSLEAASDLEEDMLDKAWGITSQSRLSCQAIVQSQDLTVEIPKYTINHARENH